MTRQNVSFFILAFSMLACNATSSVAPTSETNLDVLNTMIAQTVAAAATASAVVPAPIENEAGTADPSATPLPTSTPTATLSPTAFFTATQPIALVSVSVDTNCRNGPGKVYGYEGALLVGETAEVFARDPSGNYWYIRNPDDAGFCWVWGEYATVTGNTAALPVFTPPPTPTATNTPLPTLTPTPAPNFNFSYTSLDTCAGTWLEFKIKNTGSMTLRSIEVKLKDTVTNVTLSNLTDGFTDLNGCLTSATKDSLAPGNSLIVSAPAFGYNPSGNLIKVTLTICSANGLSGACITKKDEVTP